MLGLEFGGGREWGIADSRVIIIGLTQEGLEKILVLFYAAAVADADDGQLE